MTVSTPTARRVHLLVGLLAPAAILIANFRPVWSFTVDDAYISFRYARNLARGAGLVYNLGERVEGYTNLLWTLLLAGAIRLGLDPVQVAKILGASAAVGALIATYLLARRLVPFRVVPCLATWLLASSIVLSGHAVFGLETALFVCLIATAAWRFIAEMEQPRSFPGSGLLFALGYLTRPEAPLYLGLLVLASGRRAFARQNLFRCSIVLAVVATHVAWRHFYYGAWLPNSFFAKTGPLRDAIGSGVPYVTSYLRYQGPITAAAALGVALAVWRRERWVLAIALVTLATFGYVLLIGADWMLGWRYLAPMEPFFFLLADYGLRSITERSSRPIYLALAGLALAALVDRAQTLRRGQREIILAEKPFWDRIDLPLATWFGQHPRGLIAISDIGYAGWITDAPILDTFGLVDPVTARAPRDREHRYGRSYLDRFFARAPAYVVLLSGGGDCQHPSEDISRAIFHGPAGRFARDYHLVLRVPVADSASRCVFARSSD